MEVTKKRTAHLLQPVDNKNNLMSFCKVMKWLFRGLWHFLVIAVYLCSINRSTLLQPHLLNERTNRRHFDISNKCPCPRPVTHKNTHTCIAYFCSQQVRTLHWTLCSIWTPLKDEQGLGVGKFPSGWFAPFSRGPHTALLGCSEAARGHSDSSEGSKRRTFKRLMTAEPACSDADRSDRCANTHCCRL